MIQIAKLKILCPVCGKPDGCLVAEEGTAAICSRVSEGSIRKVGKGPFAGGWLHILGDFESKKYEVPPKPHINWNRIAVRCARVLSEHREEFSSFCQLTKINPISALRFFIGYYDGWITIPMYGRNKRISGIQKRKGPLKRHMEYSDMGVFIPASFFQYQCKTLAVCEGWSDTLTACEYGFNAIGKMNAFVGDDLVLLYAKEIKCKKVILFADNNENGVGLDGANDTASLLEKGGFPTKIVLTPEKDLRECKLRGMTLRQIINGDHNDT